MKEKCVRGIQREGVVKSKRGSNSLIQREREEFEDKYTSMLIRDLNAGVLHWLKGLGAGV